MTTIELIKKFSKLLNENVIKKITIILFLTLLEATLEVISISLVIPLVKTILNKSVFYSNEYIAFFCRIFNINNYETFIYAFIFMLVLVFTIKNAFIVLFNRYRISFILNYRLETQTKLLHIILSKPYEYFLNMNSGEIVRLVQTDVINAFSLLNSLLSISSEFIIFIILTIYVFILNFRMTLLLSIVLVSLVLILNVIINPKLRKKGNDARSNAIKSHRWLLESIHGIKQLKTFKKESFFIDNYKYATSRHIEALKTYRIFNTIPRLFIETWCVCGLLIVVAIMIKSGYDSKLLLPLISAYGMTFLKLMPFVNHFISFTNDVAFKSESLDKINDNLENRKCVKGNSVNRERITTKKSLDIVNLSYKYPNTDKYVLKDVCLSIPIGKTIGIIGKSGVGKTTLIDIILGLLNQENGLILSDGKNIKDNYDMWLNKIGYIPQNIFLFDDTIANNIVFGGEFNLNRINKALKQAQLFDFVKSLPNGIDTIVGERGIRLSQGQRQRIGIARALYVNPEILVFDEATSSLDYESEKEILESIDSLHYKKTLIIIAHRLETIKNCDEIYKIEDGNIYQTNVETIL